MDIIFLTVHPANKGGIANWVRILQNKICKYHIIHPVYLYPADFHDHEKPAIERNFFERFIRGSFLMIRTQAQLINEIIKIKKTHKANNIQEKIIVHLTSCGGISVFRDLLYACTSCLLKCPFVFHIRFGRIPQVYLENTLEWRVIKRICKLSSAVIAIDENTYTTLLKSQTEITVKKISNMLEVNDRFFLTKGIDDYKNVLFVGWVVNTKGVEELLYSWKRVHEIYPEYTLKIVGPITKEYHNKLQKEYNMDSVEIIGAVDHSKALEFIRDCSIFILPSYTEGFPNVILEAMAFGKPIIGTDVGAIREILDGCGIVIPPKDSKAVEDALIQVLSNREYQDQLGKLAKDKLMTCYSDTIIMDQYFELWNHLAN